MNILGYVVQVFHEDKLLPETGYKCLHTKFSQALDASNVCIREYESQFQEGLPTPYEFHSPTKKQADSHGYVIVFRTPEIQIWIEVIIA